MEEVGHFSRLSAAKFGDLVGEVGGWIEDRVNSEREIKLMTSGTDAKQQIYLTLSGIPLSFELKWPFHPSTSGSDFSVLHTDVRLENGSGLHAPMAVNMSATLREVMPSLEAKAFT